MGRDQQAEAGAVDDQDTGDVGHDIQRRGGIQGQQQGLADARDSADVEPFGHDDVSPKPDR